MSVRWKIYFIAIVSIIGFGSYLSFNVWVNSNNAELLSGLRSVSFPVLEKATANRVRLDRLSELLNNAVLTGELDYIHSAELSANAMAKVFSEIQQLVPNQNAQVEELISSLNEYFTPAKKIASDMAQQIADMNSIGAEVAKKEVALKKFTFQLDTFIQQAHETFSGNINTANANSKRLLTSGIIIWIINILILTVTVYTVARIILTNINNVSDSLHDIANGGGDFSKQIEVGSHDEIGKLAASFNGLMVNLRGKTNDLMSMMLNMHQGLFTITEKEVIHKEYSAYIEEIFSTKNVAGRNYADLLFANADISRDTLNQIISAVNSMLGEDEMMFDFNKHLLIKEFTILSTSPDSSAHKILELDWDPILTDGIIHKLMVTVRDVTELKLMQAVAEEQKKELQIIGEILRASPDKFDGFVENALWLLNKSQEIIASNSSKKLQSVAELFINMHTIKGNARTYNFSFIASPAHEAENIYDRLRKEDDYAWNSEALLKDLALVRETIMEYQNIKSKKLNFSAPAKIANDDLICVTKPVYQNLMAQVERVLQGPELNKQKVADIAAGLRRFDAVPFNAVIDELINSLPSLAQQLNKDPPAISMAVSSLMVRNEYVNLLNDVCTHLLRNCVDHGIEVTAERIAKHKNPQGTIYIEAKFAEQGALLLVWDDGRGLPLQRIRKSALENNYLNVDDALIPQKIAECIFLSGVSTAEKITAISGRGVGMDAVRHYLLQNGCNIRLLLADNVKVSDYFVPFKITIELSLQMYERTV